MKSLIIPTLTALILCSCSETPLFSGRVAYVSFESESGGTKVMTRYEQGIPGTSTRVKEDVWVDIYNEWVRIVLKNRNDSTTIIPRERVIQINVETKEFNELNIPEVVSID